MRLVVIAVAFGIFFGGTAAEGPPTPREALMALFDATNGTRWLRRENWTTTAHPCEWEGVECDDDRIVGLTLSGNNMEGTIPVGFFTPAMAEGLAKIDLSDNALTGGLPDATFDLFSAVSHVNLSYNDLTGRLPSSMWTSAALSVVDVQGNRFEGTLPESTTAPALYFVDLSRNRLTGPLTPSFFAGMSVLKTFRIARNFFVGDVLTALFDVDVAFRATLTEVDLSGNYFKGTLRNAMGNFSLTTFAAGDNGLFGSIPASLMKIPTLRTLRLARNSLRGALPCGWGEGLRVMDVSGNDLVGGACDVAESSPIEELYLDNNGFSLAMPKLEGRKLKAVRMGGSNRWACPLRPRIAAWQDAPPSTACFIPTVGKRVAKNLGGMSFALMTILWATMLSFPLIKVILDIYGKPIPSASTFLVPQWFRDVIRYHGPA